MVQTTENGFQIDVDGQAAVLDTRTEGDRLVLVHTGVPDAAEGQGIGSKLVRAALEHAIAEDLTIVPECPFARSWLEKHPDEAAKASIDWGDGAAPDGSDGSDA